MDLETFSDAELTNLQSDLHAEIERRRAEPLVDAARTELVVALRDAGTLDGPDVGTPDTPPEQVPSWVDPGTDHTRMYVADDVVAHVGRVWQSTHRGLNHWEPGSVGVDWRIWRDVTPVEVPADPDVPPAWSGEGVVYTAGDLVTYGGVTYRVVQGHTSAAHWTPDVVASLYAVVS